MAAEVGQQLRLGGIFVVLSARRYAIETSSILLALLRRSPRSSSSFSILRLTPLFPPTFE